MDAPGMSGKDQSFLLVLLFSDLRSFLLWVISSPLNCCSSPSRLSRLSLFSGLCLFWLNWVFCFGFCDLVFFIYSFSFTHKISYHPLHDELIPLEANLCLEKSQLVRLFILPGELFLNREAKRSAILARPCQAVRQMIWASRRKPAFLTYMASQ